MVYDGIDIDITMVYTMKYMVYIYMYDIIYTIYMISLYNSYMVYIYG